MGIANRARERISGQCYTNSNHEETIDEKTTNNNACLPHEATDLFETNTVRRSGNILSRISFRTKVFKVWKPTFWVQYGPNSLLFFRTKEDTDKWLDSSKSEKNDLVKLAINFDVRDGKVKGYNVSRTITKDTQNSLLYQFRLTRWMDYGPVLSCCFASSNLDEARVLRDVLLECAQNSPKDNMTHTALGLGLSKMEIML